MCIIVYKPKGESLPSKDTLRTCWENNPHGAGIMWADGSNVRIRKGFMSWDAFDRALDEVTSKLDVAATPMALHFRIATHGAVKPGCCHPFAVKDSYERMRQTRISADVGFMHNGTLSGLETDDSTSDSMAFARSVLVPLKRMCADFLSDKHAVRVIESSTQGSRFLLMAKDERVRTFGRWVEDGGILYSNENYLPRYAYEPTLFGETAFDAWTAFGGLDGDMSRYSMFDPCKDCPLLLECAEHLPICTDKAQASEMVASCV